MVSSSIFSANAASRLSANLHSDGDATKGKRAFNMPTLEQSVVNGSLLNSLSQDQIRTKRRGVHQQLSMASTSRASRTLDKLARNTDLNAMEDLRLLRHSIHRNASLFIAAPFLRIDQHAEIISASM
jgi:hypothetical protein